MAATKLGRAASLYLAALIGAYGGTLLHTLWSLLRPGTPAEAQDLLLLPPVVLGLGSLALPFVLVGLLVFGLPLLPALRPNAHRPWVGVVAVLWGAAAGKLLFAAAEVLMMSRDFDPLRLGSPDMGLCYGASAALAWWWLERDRARRAAG
ncbi:hypothetical protein VQH23_00390 [Pararoseomonas sp. SCSIO 73927]|uniref:hypothetical protein n=1 Tax=Pararoseomonas sp. SCSIO 73927 TaxID=3114537 RepID=UPI0030D61A79